MLVELAALLPRTHCEGVEFELLGHIEATKEKTRSAIANRVSVRFS
jgi:hypothetical protein